MRQILVDHERRKRSAKRGSGAPKVPIEDVVTFAPGSEREIEALDDALNALAVVDPRKAKVIELRFFGGFSVEETGQSLGISVATVGQRGTPRGGLAPSRDVGTGRTQGSFGRIVKHERC